jgi:ZIP family zinc transporter
LSLVWSPALAGSLGSLLAGMATALGALPILGVGRSAHRYQAIMLGFAAGIMLAASFFSLIIPALHHLEMEGAGKWNRSLIIAASLFLGAAMVMLLDRLLPAMASADGLTPASSAGELLHRRLWLFVLAITLHNVPEGLAVGVSFANGAYAEGSTTALGIGIQNIPEGFAVGGALALRYPPVTAFWGAFLSGLVEPVAGTIGALLVAHFTPLLPWALCIAAGAMISVIMSQIVPDLGREPSHTSQVSLVIGLCLMMVLDIALT